MTSGGWPPADEIDVLIDDAAIRTATRSTRTSRGRRSTLVWPEETPDWMSTDAVGPDGVAAFAFTGSAVSSSVELAPRRSLPTSQPLVPEACSSVEAQRRPSRRITPASGSGWIAVCRRGDGGLHKRVRRNWLWRAAVRQRRGSEFRYRLQRYGLGRGFNLADLRRLSR